MEADVLEFLAVHGEVSAMRLAKSFELPLSTMLRTLSMMAAQGMVELLPREGSPAPHVRLKQVAHG
ncbi:helix-turn-helix domain-containing protein [Burkholderiaceae bacterium DAT-1]|nr:helix-turn-helix domain-containing protein [Burkholderiaceae bacterium DAT-1]